MAQQFLAQCPARAAPSVPRSPARSRCRRAHGAPGTRCTRAQQRWRIEGGCLHGSTPIVPKGQLPRRRGEVHSRSVVTGGHRWSDAGHVRTRSDHRRAVPQRHRRTRRRDGADHLPHRLFRGAEEHHGLQCGAVRRARPAGGAGPRPAGPSLLHPGRTAGGAAALRRRHRRGRHPDQQRPLRRRHASAGHLHLQAAVRRRAARRQADRLCRDDLPPHRCRRTRAGLQRVGQHRDLRRGPAHPAAEALRTRQAEHHAVPHDRPQRAGAGTRAGRHPQPARRLRDRRARHGRSGGSATAPMASSR